MSKKTYKPTLRDLLLSKQVSKNVKERGEALDKQMSIIMKERKKRKAKNKHFGRGMRSETEKKAIETALRIASRPSPSGKKFPRMGTNKKMF